MKKLLTTTLATVMTLTAFVAAQPASAHRIISGSQAIDKVKNIYASHCGNDDANSTWICDGWKYEYVAPVGLHSYAVEIHWSEVRVMLNWVPRWDVRGCGVQARVEHDWVAEIITPEWCWWQ